MNSPRPGIYRVAAPIVVLLGIGALFAWRFDALAAPTTVASVRSVQQQHGKPVEVMPVRHDHLVQHVTLAGTVEGTDQYAIVSNNQLRVDRIVHREGARIAAGDPVILLERTASSPMQHSYMKYLAVYEDAERDLRRFTDLHAEGAVSTQTLDKATMALEVARTNLSDARGATDLHAVRAGQVLRVLVEEGETVRPGAPLVLIAGTDSVRVIFGAGSRQALALAIGQPAVWRHPVKGNILHGLVTKLDLAADPGTHLLAGEVLFANPDHLLLPGLLVSIEVETVNRRDVLTVPTQALEPFETGYAVFVIDSSQDSRPVARSTAIEIGLKTTDLAEVTSGLNPGDEVVVFGKTSLQDGDAVRLIKVQGAR